MMTLKQLGDAIRKDLKGAQAAVQLPAALRFAVRATRSKHGWSVNITIDNADRLIPDPKEQHAKAWLAGDGERIRQQAERIRNAWNRTSRCTAARPSTAPSSSAPPSPA